MTQTPNASTAALARASRATATPSNGTALPAAWAARPDEAPCACEFDYACTACLDRDGL